MGRHLEQRLGRRIFKIDTLLAGPFRASQVFAGGVDETRRAKPGCTVVMAATIHSRGATIGVVEQLAMPADPDRALPPR